MAVSTPVRLDPGDHVLHFYADDADLAATVGPHLAEGLASGDTIVVIGTAAHRAALADAVAAAGADADAARASGRMVEVDAIDLLRRLTVGGAPDPAAFEALVGGLMRRADSGGRPVRAYGELVGLLWDAGQVNAAIVIEELWNGLARRLPFSLVCGYPLDAPASHDHGAVAHVCALHADVVRSPPGMAAHARRRFDATPLGPRAARRFVVGTLRDWGREDLIEDAMLVSAELATNAVMHAGSDFEVIMTRRDDGIVRICVRDASTARPVLRTPHPDIRGGRGLALIAALAVSWGHKRVDGGKQVWADLGARTATP